MVREERSGPYADVPAFKAIRTTSQHPLGRWHYTEWETGERELYDSVEDPWELTNLVKDEAYADVVDQLAADLEAEFRRPREAARSSSASWLATSARGPRPWVQSPSAWSSLTCR